MSERNLASLPEYPAANNGGIGRENNTALKGPRRIPEGSEPSAKRMKRLNINLPEPAYEELEILAKESGRTLTEIVRESLRLRVIAHDERKAGNRLAIVDRHNKIVKEILLTS